MVMITPPPSPPQHCSELFPLLQPRVLGVELVLPCVEATGEGALGVGGGGWGGHELNVMIINRRWAGTLGIEKEVLEDQISEPAVLVL